MRFLTALIGGMTALLLLLGGWVVFPEQATAQTCTSTVEGQYGPIVIEIACEGSDGSGGGDPSGLGTRVCTRNGAEIPCSSAQGSWVASLGCYVALASPQPPKEDPVWEGRTEGAIFTCLVAGGFAFGMPIYVWLPTATPPPDPRVLAVQAVNSMNLGSVSIGIVPEPTPGSVGIIGLPVWLWVANPGPSITGPISRSASAGGYTVTANAALDRIAYTMGDGTTVICHGPGTPYQDSYGRAPSPTCGHTYTKQGTYTVTATSFWVINWTGIGQTGSLNRTFSSSVQIQEGEIQVLNR